MPANGRRDLIRRLKIKERAGKEGEIQLLSFNMGERNCSSR